MLDSLRAFAKTLIARVLLVVLVISFGAFGINNVITNFGSSTVARVGDEDISIRAFQRAYGQQLDQMSQQLGRVPTPEEAQSLGIPGSVLQQLSAQASLDQLTAQLGLGVSQDKLAELVRKDPSFRGTLGGFSTDNFKQILAQGGYTEAEYIEAQTRAARRQQFVQAMFVSAAVPEAAQSLINRYSGDKRSVEYFLLNERTIPAIPAPTEDELKAYLAAHQPDFRTPETRTVDVLTLSPESVANSISVPDDQVAAEYERTKAGISTPEKRTIRQVNLPVEGLVVAFQNGKAQGKSFGDLANQAGEKVSDLGTLAKSEITDPALAEAAFGLVPGDFTIIEGVGGKRAITVTAVQPANQPTLEQAKPDIIKRLALAQARNKFGDVQDEVEELRAAFQPLQAIADRYKLPLQTVPVTANGDELAQLADIGEADRPRVAQAIFKAQQGQLAPAVNLSANHYVFFDLKSVQPARDQTLDEVRDKLVAAVTQEKTDAAVAAQVKDVLNQLQSGKAFTDAAAALGQFPQLSLPVSRSGDGTNLFNADVGSAVFAGGPDHFGAAKNGDGDQVVFHVVQVAPAEGTATGQSRDYIADSVRNSLYNEFIAGLRTQTGVRVNQQALQQVLAVGAP